MSIPIGLATYGRCPLSTNEDPLRENLDFPGDTGDKGDMLSL